MMLDKPPQDQGKMIPKGGRLNLKCQNKDCWIDDIWIISKGGAPKGPPQCPSCHGPLEAQGGVYVPDDC